jgi:AcrR family transcriptional regulator
VVDAAKKRHPSQARSRVVFDAIVSASIDLFRRRDRDSISIRDIAERAGVGTGSVYDYFEGRGGVLAAVHDRVTRDNFEDMLARWEGYGALPLDDAMVAMLDDTIDLYLGRGALTRISIEVLSRLGSARHVIAERDRFCRALLPRFTSELPTVPRDEIEASVVGAVDMIMGVLVSELYRPPSEARRRAARALAERVLRAEIARLRAAADAASSR